MVIYNAYVYYTFLQIVRAHMVGRRAQGASSQPAKKVKTEKSRAEKSDR